MSKWNEFSIEPGTTLEATKGGAILWGMDGKLFDLDKEKTLEMVRWLMKMYQDDLEKRQEVNSANFIANSGDPVHQAAENQYKATLPPGVNIRGVTAKEAIENISTWTEGSNDATS